MSTHILLAEDNDKLAGLMLTLLKKKGFSCERVADGISVLQKVATSPPALLILDLRLPKLHGIELLKKLRTSPKTKDLPVMIVTGVYRGEKYIKSARSLGVDIYLEKPFGSSQFLEGVQSALGAKQKTVAPATSAPTKKDQLPVILHLIQAHAQRYSGTCRLLSKSGAHSIIFIDGSPVSLRPGFKHKNFGDYLLKKGLLKEEEYRYYATTAAFKHEAFVQMGALAYPDLLQEKLRYLTEELIYACALPPMEMDKTDISWPSHSNFLTVNLPQILLSGYHRLTKKDDKTFCTKHQDEYPVLNQDYYKRANFLSSLTLDEKRFLGKCTGKVQLKDALADLEDIEPIIRFMSDFGILTFSATPSESARPEIPVRTLFNAIEEEESVEEVVALESFDDLLDEDDIVIPEPTQPPPKKEEPVKAPSAPEPTQPAGEEDIATKVRNTYERLKDKNHYEIFDLKIDRFSFESLKSNYFAITREFGPEVMMQLYGEEAEMVQEILANVTTAYNTLSNAVKKERYDEMLGADKIGLGHKGDDKFQAEVQFESGRTFLDMEDWEGAEKSLKDACHSAPDNGEYLAYLSWATYKNPKNANSRATLDKARKDINRALTMQKSAGGFAFKGWILFEAGQDSLAESEFNKALRIDSRQMLARKGLRSIQQKQEDSKKGLFKRMFG